MTSPLPQPTIHPTAFIAEGAIVRGDVTLDEDVSIWYGAVLRGDVDGITIGARTNIQDNAVVHEDVGRPVHIGSDVTVGHGAIVHGCTIGDNTLIGMGAIVLNGAHVGTGCIIGAGALVTQGMQIPDGSVAFGSPARVVRQTTKEERAHTMENARAYVEEAARYRQAQQEGER